MADPISLSLIGSSLMTTLSSSTLLSGIGMAASAFSSIQSGNAQASALNVQARQSEASARLEKLKGRQTALSIQKQLDRDLSSQTATFAARGVMSGEGSAAAAADVSKENARQDINIARFGEKMAAEGDLMQAAQYRSEGKAARRAGQMEAVSTLMGSRTVRNATRSLLEV